MEVQATVRFITVVPDDWVLDDLYVIFNSNGDPCLTDGNLSFALSEIDSLISVKKVGES